MSFLEAARLGEELVAGLGHEMAHLRRRDYLLNLLCEALLVPIFYAVNVAVAYRLTQVFHAGYRLRHAYGKLTEDYSVLNQRLERQLGELEEARRQVEASGRKLSLFADRNFTVTNVSTVDGYQMITDYQMDDFAKSKIAITNDELVGERDTVKDMHA